jgi:phosphopantothenate synthetase
MREQVGSTTRRLVILALAIAMPQGLSAQTLPPVANAVLVAEDDSGVVSISGNHESLRVEAHQVTLATVLAALGKLNLRYRTSLALDEIVDGTYEGTIGHVLRRFLTDYNYAIKQDKAKLEVTVFGARGDHPVVSPSLIIRIRQRPSD